MIRYSCVALFLRSDKKPICQADDIFTRSSASAGADPVECMVMRMLRDTCAATSGNPKKLVVDLPPNKKVFLSFSTCTRLRPLSPCHTYLFCTGPGHPNPGALAVAQDSRCGRRGRASLGEHQSRRHRGAEEGETGDDDDDDDDDEKTGRRRRASRRSRNVSSGESRSKSRCRKLRHRRSRSSCRGRRRSRSRSRRRGRRRSRSRDGRSHGHNRSHGHSGSRSRGRIRSSSRCRSRRSTTRKRRRSRSRSRDGSTKVLKQVVEQVLERRTKQPRQPKQQSKQPRQQPKQPKQRPRRRKR